MYRIALGRSCMCCSTDIVFRDAAGYCDVIASLRSVRQWRSPWVGTDISGAEWRNAQMSTECTQRVHLYIAPVPNTTSGYIRLQHLPHCLSVPLQYVTSNVHYTRMHLSCCFYPLKQNGNFEIRIACLPSVSNNFVFLPHIICVLILFPK
jgi:hypothetical protein